ncbi:high-temperature-induced dauer-formation protein-domain-containing protein [Zopfochytrium polystomum]|nr:high-temperature-induced dauer-formation protein-domain-containing protein [Zopfochytrium polystomum]
MGATESTLAFRKNNLSDDEFFAQFYQLPTNAEEIFNLFSPKDIRFVRDSAPENLQTLCKKLSARIFRFTSLETAPTKEDIRDVLNCSRILTRIVPYIFETATSENLAETIFWTRSSDAADAVDDRLGPKLIRSVVQLLFYKGLTLPDSVSKDPGVRYVIWDKGVGASAAPSAPAAIIANRIEVLRLFLALLSSGMYHPAATSMKVVNKWAVTVGTGLEKKAVLTLLCSLLNVPCNYDPVGWGLIPYNHVFFTDSHEQLVTLCLETLIVLLDFGGGAPLTRRQSISVHAEVTGEDGNPTVTSDTTNPDTPKEAAVPNSGNNDFRLYAAKLHRVEDFRFMMDGICRALKNPLDTANTYLPGANKRISIHTEVLMLFWELMDVNELGLVRTCCFLLHMLSQDRAFAVQLNTAFDASIVGVASKSLPMFAQGNFGDFLFLAIHAIITTTSKTPVASLHENFLITLTNVSPFVKSLTVVTVNKLLGLFMSFSNPGYMLSNETNHKMVFYILDVFNNMVQYQITGNTHLVYAIVRHKNRFHELHEMTFESATEELNRLRDLKLQRLRKLEQAGVHGDASASPTLPRQSVSPPDEAKAATANSTPSTPVQNGGGALQSPGSVTGVEAAPTAGETEKKGGAPPPASPIDSLSDKAKGKLPAAVVGEKPKFEPTIEWFNYWKSHLRLHLLLTLVDALGPPIENLCLTQGLNDDRKVIEYLQSGTLVGLLPLPNPIYIRKFTFTEPVRVWFMSYMWGCVFVKSTSPSGGAEMAKLCPAVWTGKGSCRFCLRNESPAVWCEVVGVGKKWVGCCRG